ncbi:hypothetical protein PHISCL_02939 [Aspergillus sclerotialis]|uniref:Uncharacterized protein n=1 Tax=Aspergillus sclerotialis TaxID=2070753 RepID=A0A3A2ZPV9_9EURO|nr:hypothetical protein PHISCL_02939 [Aspergillus sclerotialis]
MVEGRFSFGDMAEHCRSSDGPETNICVNRGLQNLAALSIPWLIDAETSGTGNQESGGGDIEVGDIEGGGGASKRQLGDCGCVIETITRYLDLDLQDGVTMHVSCGSSCNIAQVRSDVSAALGVVGQRAIDLGAYAVNILVPRFQHWKVRCRAHGFIIFLGINANPMGPHSQPRRQADSLAIE